MAKTEKNIYRVRFSEPPISEDRRTEFFFTSLAAIYEVFTPKQVGCKVSRLYNIGVPDGKPYNGELCQIMRETILSKAQKTPYSFDNSMNDSLHQSEK